jgi:hypothetical protein
MPDNFQLNAHDDLVQLFLTRAERANIVNAQNTDAWEFEFHRGHDTGSPFYMRPRGCTLGQNLTKFDTHTINGAPLAYNNQNLRNRDVIERTCKMSARDKEAMFRVISTNWALMGTLSLRWWGGIQQGEIERRAALAQAAVANQQPAVARTRVCGLPVPWDNGNACTGQVSTNPGRWPCDTCGQFSQPV